MAKHRAPGIATNLAAPPRERPGRHAKRTRVTSFDGEVRLGLGRWRVELATFDRPANPQVIVGRVRALTDAHRFERVKAEALRRTEEALARQPMDEVA
jgi:hypothetical protein